MSLHETPAPDMPDWEPPVMPRWRQRIERAPVGSVYLWAYADEQAVAHESDRRSAVAKLRRLVLDKYEDAYGLGAQPESVHVAFGRSDMPLAGGLVISVLAVHP